MESFLALPVAVLYWVLAKSPCRARMSKSRLQVRRGPRGETRPPSSVAGSSGVEAAGTPSPALLGRAPPQRDHPLDREELRQYGPPPLLGEASGPSVPRLFNAATTAPIHKRRRARLHLPG